MPEIWTMGELLVEIMRPRPDLSLREAAEFVGPFPSGAPAIFADTVARLGHGSGMIGSVGDDDFGRCLVDRLKRDGVDCSLIDSGQPLATGVAFVSYRSDGSRQFIYHAGNTPAAPDLSRLETPAFFHLMGCSLFFTDGMQDDIVKTVEGFAARGAKISFDPNIRVELLRGRSLEGVLAPVMDRCAVLHPGLEELLALAGEPDLERAVARMFQRPKLEIIAMKRGKRGCTVFTRERRFDMGVFAVDPVDPTGAGDAFDAGFLCGLLEGRPLEECARLGSAAAALNTAAFGPMEGRISPETVKAMMAGPMVAPAP